MHNPGDMTALWLASVIWALSFGLIGHFLGDLPPVWLGWVRLGLGALMFLPWAKRIPVRLAGRLLGLGAVQFGLMYWAYLASFRHATSHEVALFTATTPLLVAALSDMAGRRMRPRNLAAALLAVAAGGLVVWHRGRISAPLFGFGLVQVSNLCFALGQLGYRRIRAGMPRELTDRDVFFWLQAGGWAVLTPPVLPVVLRTMPAPSPAQWGLVVYLGIVATGGGFFLWNHGARKVDVGRLAVMNNLKIPLGALISLLVFREEPRLFALTLGGVLLAAALVLAWRRERIRI